jgi:hypothetical protein
LDEPAESEDLTDRPMPAKTRNNIGQAVLCSDLYADGQSARRRRANSARSGRWCEPPGQVRLPVRPAAGLRPHPRGGDVSPDCRAAKIARVVSGASVGTIKYIAGDLFSLGNGCLYREQTDTVSWGFGDFARSRDMRITRHEVVFPRRKLGRHVRRIPIRLRATYKRVMRDSAIGA